MGLKPIFTTEEETHSPAFLLIRRKTARAENEIETQKQNSRSRDFED